MGSRKAAQTMNLPNNLSRSQTFIISTIGALVLIYPATSWADECMATLKVRMARSMCLVMGI
jgi:hypothetical protein